jgi:hypothetical protein
MLKNTSFLNLTCHGCQEIYENYIVSHNNSDFLTKTRFIYKELLNTF